MSPRHRTYLLLEQGIGAGIFNVVLNAGIAWLFFHDMSAVPLVGDRSIAADTLGTAFMLPLLTAVIGGRIVRAHVRTSHVPAWPCPAGVARLIPRSLAARGTLLGVACVLLVGFPTTSVLRALGVTAWSLSTFVTFKASFAGVLATVVTPLVARASLADAPPVPVAAAA
jgi:hypothetical protein